MTSNTWLQDPKPTFRLRGHLALEDRTDYELALTLLQDEWQWKLALPTKRRHEALGYTPEAEKVWYTTPAQVPRSYLLCLNRSVDLFNAGCELIPHLADEKLYRKFLTGDFSIDMPVAILDGGGPDLDIDMPLAILDGGEPVVELGLDEEWDTMFINLLEEIIEEDDDDDADEKEGVDEPEVGKAPVVHKPSVPSPLHYEIDASSWGPFLEFRLSAMRLKNRVLGRQHASTTRRMARLAVRWFLSQLAPVKKSGTVCSERCFGGF